MSTPISGTDGAGLLGALTNPQTASASANKAKASQTGPTTDGTSQAAAMLNAGLQPQAATSSVNQLSQAFDRAMLTATTVDPSTGVREVSASSATQLGTSLDSFLQQSGFSQQQADAASKAFVAALAQGGPVDLNASYDDATALGTSMTATYGSQTMSASSVALTERSGSVSIQFDPTTGKLRAAAPVPSMRQEADHAKTEIDQTWPPSKRRIATTHPLAFVEENAPEFVHAREGHA
jgi:hypothetical protein